MSSPAKAERSHRQDLMSNSRHATVDHLNYPIRHASPTSDRIPFMTVVNTRHDDPLDHYCYRHSPSPTQTTRDVNVSIDVSENAPEEFTVDTDGGKHEDKHDGHRFYSGDETKPEDQHDGHKFYSEEIERNEDKHNGHEIISGVEEKHEDKHKSHNFYSEDAAEHENKHNGHGFYAGDVVKRVYVPATIDTQNIHCCDVSNEGIFEISIPGRHEGDELKDKTSSIHFKEDELVLDGRTEGTCISCHADDKRQYSPLETTEGTCISCHAGDKRHYSSPKTTEGTCICCHVGDKRHYFQQEIGEGTCTCGRFGEKRHYFPQTTAEESK